MSVAGFVSTSGGAGYNGVTSEVTFYWWRHRRYQQATATFYRIQRHH